MKPIIFFIGILFLILSCKSQKSNTKTMEMRLPKIGMDINQFAKEFPDVINGETNGNKQYSDETKVQNLDGKWSYDFKENRLKWFMYNSYNYETNQENFNKYLAAAQNIINEFKEKYGEPAEFEFKNKTFKDPYNDHHWGYHVISALWRTDEMDFKVSFKFNGSKGEYYYLLKMEFHESGYEYF